MGAQQERLVAKGPFDRFNPADRVMNGAFCVGEDKRIPL